MDNMRSTLEDILDSCKIFIFDMNGVLKNDEPDHFNAFRAALEDHSSSLTHDEYLMWCSGLSDKQGVINLIQEKSIPISVDSLIQLKQEKYNDITEIGNLNAFPGALELLEKLKQKDKICFLVTSATVKEAVEFITEGRFDKVFSDDKSYYGVERDQRQAIYQEIVAVSGNNAEQCVLLDDSAWNLHLAKQLKIRTIGVATTRPADQLEADAIVSDVETILKTYLTD